MTLLHGFIIVGSPQVPFSRGVGVGYKFIEGSAFHKVIQVSIHAQIFGTSYEVDALQNNQMEKNLLLRVSFPISFAVKLCSKV